MVDDMMALIPLPLDSNSLAINHSSFILAIQEVSPSDGAIFSLLSNQVVSFADSPHSALPTGPVSLSLPVNFTFTGSNTVRLTHAILNSLLFPELPSNQRFASVIMATSLVGHTLSSPVTITFEKIKVCLYLFYLLNDSHTG